MQRTPATARNIQLRYYRQIQDDTGARAFRPADPRILFASKRTATSREVRNWLQMGADIGEDLATFRCRYDDVKAFGVKVGDRLESYEGIRVSVWSVSYVHDVSSERNIADVVCKRDAQGLNDENVNS